jgi:hypothetical protein
MLLIITQINKNRQLSICKNHGGLSLSIIIDFNRPVGVYQNGLPARSAKIYALQNARKLCFEWGIGDNDAPTVAYKVAAAAKSL